MTDLRKAAEMALEALDGIHVGNMTPMAEENWNKATEALRQALAQPWDTTDMAYRPNGLSVEQSIAQPEQEPVAWMYVNEDGECEQIEYGVSTIEAPYIKLLYTAPPSKPWVSLTDEEIADAVGSPIDEVYLNDFRKVEAALRSKNDPTPN